MRQIFNIGNNDTDVISHLRRQENMSRYIVNLIRRDMDSPDSLERRIRNLIEEMLREYWHQSK